MLWVAALLSSLLSLDALFKSDADDGTLEQLALCGQGLTRHRRGQDLGSLAGDRRCVGAGLAAGGDGARAFRQSAFANHDAESWLGHLDLELAGRHWRGPHGGPAARQRAAFTDRAAARHAAADFRRRRDRSGDFGNQRGGRLVFSGGAVRVHVHVGAVRGDGGVAYYAWNNGLRNHVDLVL